MTSHDLDPSFCERLSQLAAAMKHPIEVLPKCDIVEDRQVAQQDCCLHKGAREDGFDVAPAAARPDTDARNDAFHLVVLGVCGEKGSR